MITWPRVRITFAVIGMLSTAIFLWDQIGIALGLFQEFALYIKGLFA